MRYPSKQLRLTKGFTLLEGVIAMVAGAAILVGVGAFAISIRQFRQEERIALEAPLVFEAGIADAVDTRYSAVPSSLELEAAIDYHFLLQQLIDKASAVYVFGGRGEQFGGNPLVPSGTFDGNGESNNGLDLGPISMGNEPPLGESLGIAMNDIRSLSSSRELRDVLDDDYFLDEPEDPGDFTLVTVVGLDQVSGIAQVRRREVGDKIFYYARLRFDGDLLGTRITLPIAPDVAALNPDSTADTLIYRCVARETEESNNAPLGVGAAHFWFREDPHWQRSEQAAVRVIFPDPFFLQATDVQAGFSRFSYFQGVQL